MSAFLRFVAVAAIGASIAISRADPILEDIFEKNYPVAATTKLSIRNTDGSIRIYGAEINEIKIQAVKKAYAADRLRQISIIVSADSNKISIDTKYPPKPKWGFFDRSGTVDYVVVVPLRCSIANLELKNGEILLDGVCGRDIHASLGSGRMFGHNCFGDLHLNVTEGAIDIGYDWWEDRGCSIDANIVNGNVRALMPDDAAFHLLATTTNGQIASDFSEKQDRVPGGVQAIDTVVNGDSESNLRIHATNGSIQITEINL